MDSAPSLPNNSLYSLLAEVAPYMSPRAQLQFRFYEDGAAARSAADFVKVVFNISIIIERHFLRKIINFYLNVYFCVHWFLMGLIY